MPIPESATRLHSIDLVKYDIDTRKSILRLELLLKTLHEKLQHIYNHEVGSDTEEDEEICLWEERLEKRIMMVWKKMCRLTKRKVSKGRHVDTKISFQGSRHKEINVAVENFLNTKRIFPDYGNILSIVEQVNVSHQLMLQKGEQESIAREIFASVGSLLKKNRLKDFVDLFGCQLTDGPWDYDPAVDNAALQQRLQKNKVIGDMKLNKVLKYYAEQQVLSKQVPEEVPDETADLSEEDEESEKGDEEDNFESELDSSLNNKKSCDDSEDHCTSEDILNSMDFSANPPTLKGDTDESDDSEMSVILESDDDSKHNLSLSCEESPSLLQAEGLEDEKMDCDTLITNDTFDVLESKLPLVASEVSEMPPSSGTPDDYPHTEVKEKDVTDSKIISGTNDDNESCDVIVIDSDDSES